MVPLEISIVAYQRPALLRTLLWSLAAQTNQDFQISVWHDGPSDEIESIVDRFAKQNAKISVEYFATKERFNNYGHSLRALALQRCKTEYMLLTNDDNYYVPIFVDEILNANWSCRDVIYFDMVHSHLIPDLPNPIGYQTLIAEPRLARMDIGSFVFKTKLGEKVGFKDRSFTADWEFFEGLLAAGARLEKISKVLFVHN